MAHSRLAFVLLAFLAAPGVLLAQGVPQGPEFRVNSYITGRQSFPVAAFDSAGNFVVLWESYGDGTGLGLGISGQRYSGGGAPQGGEFRVNSYITSTQRYPSVASDPAGNFVVAWQSFTQDGSGWGIFAQRYTSTGAPLGGEFRVNTHTLSEQWYPSMASDSAGNFVVTWSSRYQDGDFDGIFAQRYASNGAPLGGEFRVNTYTTEAQKFSSVAVDSAGNFVVVWESFEPFPGGIFAQRYANTGIPLGGEFRISSITITSAHHPWVASDSAGNFVVVWASHFLDGSGWGIFAQRIASNGTSLGGAFRVNSYTTSHQYFPSVASDSAGNFVVAWDSITQDGSDWGAFAQRYASTGAPAGGEFQLNTYTTNDQREPVVAADPAGNFVVVWQSYTQDGSSYGVFAQRYSMIVPVELQSFRVE